MRMTDVFRECYRRVGANWTRAWTESYVVSRKQQLVYDALNTSEITMIYHNIRSKQLILILNDFFHNVRPQSHCPGD